MPKKIKDKKKTEKKSKPEMVEVQKSVLSELAACTLFALKFLRTKSGGGVAIDFKTMKCEAWEEKFMKALDGVGYCIDRKEFWKSRDKKMKTKHAKVGKGTGQPHPSMA